MRKLEQYLDFDAPSSIAIAHEPGGGVDHRSNAVARKVPAVWSLLAADIATVAKNCRKERMRGLEGL